MVDIKHYEEIAIAKLKTLEYKQKNNDLNDSEIENIHYLADNILLEFICNITKNNKIAEEFENIDKYYSVENN